MGDRLRAGIPPWYVTKPTRSTQPCIPLGSLNRVPALIGWGKGGNVTSAGWQVILCDPVWHVSSRSSEACCELLYPVTLLTANLPSEPPDKHHLARSAKLSNHFSHCLACSVVA